MNLATRFKFTLIFFNAKGAKGAKGAKRLILIS